MPQVIVDNPNIAQNERGFPQRIGKFEPGSDGAEPGCELGGGGGGVGGTCTNGYCFHIQREAGN